MAPPPVPQAVSPTDIIKAIPQGNNTTLVNVAPPTVQHQTLPDFLGITRCCFAAIECCNIARTQAANCFPGLADVIDPGAGVPPLGEAEGGPPAVEAAAAIKAKEGEAAAKIAALRYLAKFGCGCYNKDGSIEEAFVVSLDDCTEAVRYEAVMALRKTTSCGKCQCNEKACCSEKIQKKLREMAFETDDNGCPKEPSERVRRKARLVLRACGPPVVEPTPPEEEPEEPTGPPPELPAGVPTTQTPSVPAPEAGMESSTIPPPANGTEPPSLPPPANGTQPPSVPPPAEPK